MRVAVVACLAILAAASALLPLSGRSQAAFRGDNGKLAFVSDRDGDDEIFTVDADGGQRARLTDNSDDDFEPGWSADGRRLVFVSDRRGTEDIYKMDADGSDRVRLTHNAGVEGEPAFSPDGKQIVFQSDRDGDVEIFKMDADGSDVRKLTDNSVGDFEPTWSQDGDKIAFRSTRDGNSEIYKMDPDGSDQNRLTNDPGFDGHPNWSPDSEQIAFQSDRDGNDNIYEMEADGSDENRLTQSAADDGRPVWSPNGRRIAFQSDRGGDLDIYTMQSDGSDEERLDNQPGDEFQLDWRAARGDGDGGDEGNDADEPPTLVPMTTIARGGASPVSIGGKAYGGGGLNLVVVDRTSLAAKAYTYPAQASELAHVADVLAGLDDGSLAIVTAPGGLSGVTPASLDLLNTKVLRPIGVKPFPSAGAVEGTPFSVLGVPGWKVEAGFGNLGAPIPQRGALTGYLQRDVATQSFGFVYGDYVPFDTKAVQSSTSNTMRIGAATYSNTLEEGSGGIHIVAVDPRTLALITVPDIPPFPPEEMNEVWPLNTGDLNRDRILQIAFGRLLGDMADRGAVVFLQTVGNPRPTTDGWNDISAGIEKLGGISALAACLGVPRAAECRDMGDGSRYALAASAMWKDAAEESVVDVNSSQTGSITGLLARDTSSRFQPLMAKPGDAPASGELLQIAYRPLTAWPMRDSPGHIAALDYVAGQLELGTDDPRKKYQVLTQTFDPARVGCSPDPGTGAERCVIPFPGGRTDFNPTELADVQKQLHNEFDYVTRVRLYFEQLRTVMTESVIIGQGKLAEITKNLEDVLPDVGGAVEVSPWEVYSNLFKVGGKLAPDPEAEEAANGVAEIFSLVATATKGKDGKSLLDEFRTQRTQIGIDLTNRYSSALFGLDQTQSILVTDWGKLQDAGQRIRAGKPGWAWTLSSRAVVKRGLEIGAKRLIYGTMVPTAFRLYYLPDYDGYPNPDQCRVLAGEAASAWMLVTSRFASDGGRLSRQTLPRALGDVRDRDVYGGRYTPAFLTDPLFKPIPHDQSSPGLGLFKPTFLVDNFQADSLSRHACNPT